MHQDTNRFAGAAFPLQPHGSDSHSSPTNRCERTLITLIRATNVASRLRRMPAGFHVIVEVDGRIIQTSNKPVSIGKDVVEWDEEIFLPSNQLSSISFSVYASFELGPRLGNGELLRQFKSTVGEVIHNQNEQLQPGKVDISPLCLSLDFTTEQRICDTNDHCLKLNIPEPHKMDAVEQLTGEGHHALLRYRQRQDQRDLDAATQAFERVQEICLIDHPNRSAVLFNLANARFIDCQANNRYLDLDGSIELYRDALRLRNKNHPDHCATALELGLALLARFQKRGSEVDKEEATALLAGVVDVTAAESYAHRAGLFGLRMADASVPVDVGDAGSSQAEQATDEDAIQETRDLLRNVSHWSPRRPSLLVRLGMLLSNRFQRSGVLTDIHEAISMFEHALDLGPGNHPDMASLLDYLGRALLLRFSHLGDLVDITRSVSTSEEAVCLTPDGHLHKPARLSNLGCSLLSRFERLGDLRDLNRSISKQEEGVCLTPDHHQDKPRQLNNLGTSLFRRFERIGNLADLNRSISMIEEAVCLSPEGHPDRPQRLNNLGNSLFRRFERLGDRTDLNRSILMGEEAVCLIPNGHPDKPVCLNNLGSSLFRLFEHLGDLADLNRSISMYEDAVCLTPHCHPDRPGRLNNLGTSLFRRFERLGDLADLNRSILMFDAVGFLRADGHLSELVSFQNFGNAGNALLSRFRRLGDLADLHKSISMFEKAVCLTAGSHPEKPACLNNLGNSLFRRFERLGNLADLNKSILMVEEVVCLTADDHPDKPRRLNNLGNSLYRRFGHLGDLADLTRSISVYEEAISLIPDGHPDKPGCLNNLGNSLLSLFGRLVDLADLNRSILMFEEAVRLSPDDHPDKPHRLNNLGNSLLYRFERIGNITDLNRSISMKEEALHLTPNGHPEKPNCLNNLGTSLFRRFERLSNYADIVKSIAMKEEAISFTPDGHPDKLTFLISLGEAFNVRFKHSHDPSDLSAAASKFSIVSRASIGPASTHFHAARAWISCEQLRGNTTALLNAYASALDLLPHLAWLGLPVTERHRLLIQVADVTRDSVAAALEAGQPELAVEWLEQGRSVVWSQFLQLRTPVDDLAHQHPALALQFRQISQELERASARDNPTLCQSANISVTDTRLLEKDIQRHHDLALERENLLVRIRSLPGFDRFLLSKTIKQLSALAISGPIIYLTASKERCDALIVMAELDNVIHVPLPEIRHVHIEVLRRVLRTMLERHCLVLSRNALHEVVPSEDIDLPKDILDLLLDRDVPDGSDRAVKTKPQRFGGYTPNELYQMILKLLWNHVANPVLQALGFSSPPSGADKMTRIFWCPTGPFSFLPIHAAGLYDIPEAGTKLSDFVISSYLPTLSSLASSPRSSLHESSSNLRLLAVPQPPTDGLGRLFSVEDEVNSIRELSDKSLFINLQDSDGTVNDVMEKLKNTDWVHFACHGIQDPKKPLDSGLGLANKRRLKLSEIMQLSRPQGGLAFLSACQTAQGDETLSEESVHLAAGMLFAGYGSVIGTMWAIRDDDAPKVARDVYEHLFRDASRAPDCTEAAAALHRAIQHLRESGASFSSWVPFIHFGR